MILYYSVLTLAVPGFTCLALPDLNKWQEPGIEPATRNCLSLDCDDLVHNEFYSRYSAKTSVHL